MIQPALVLTELGATFNSLSRDHGAGPSSHIDVEAVTSFNSLSRDHIQNRLRIPPANAAESFQLPLSGSPRRRRDLTAIREKPFNSLSRDHLLVAIPAVGYPRVHLSTPSLGITRSSPAPTTHRAHNILSTPSLGITVDEMKPRLEVRIEKSFNSLSRDHGSWSI